MKKLLLTMLIAAVSIGHPVKVTPLDPVPGFDVPPALPVEPIEGWDGVGPKPLPGGRSYVSREQFLAEQELEWKRVSTLKK